MAQSNFMRDSELFDKAVETFFDPLAKELGLPLSKVRDGVYDIFSPHFIMRIRLDTGHARGLNVILRPGSIRDCDENDYSIEQLGIGNFIKFYGEEWNEPLIDTDKDFLNQAHRLAAVAKRHLAQYLLGNGKDWEAIRSKVKSASQKRQLEMKYPWMKKT